ncbi:MAG TPA: cytochrome c [Phycisphaerales bacterium]|nr:cytochrome c [Phycisphaerales bacterium]
MNMHDTTTRVRHTLAMAGLGVLCLAGLSACQGERSDEPPHQFLPDMDDSPKFKPQTETEFFADGRAMRPHVPGTVAFGDTTRVDDLSRARYLRASAEVWDGLDPAGTPLAEGEPAYAKTIPGGALEVFKARLDDHHEPYADDADAMKKMITRGQERFNIYCSVCHGFKGEGSDPANFTGGIVGRRWKTPVPNFHDPKYSDKTVKTGLDGYVFNVIRHGVPDADPAKPLKMPSYADKVSEIDAWAIVSYVRTLQAAWTEQTPTPPATSGGNAGGAK